MSDKENIAAQTAEMQEGLVNPVNQVYFRAGLLACREYMARFVESQDPVTAASIRANWWPDLGADPGKPRRLEFGEIANGGEEGPWTYREDISPSTEALPVALNFLLRDTSPASDAVSEDKNANQT